MQTDQKPLQTDQWTSPQSIPVLRAGAIQVWRIDLDEAEVSRQEIGALLHLSAEVLTGEERERAVKMRAGRARNEFVVGRGCLRRLLGEALDQEPRAVELAVGQHGKPGLGAEAEGRLWFNLSHSRGVILLAMSRAGVVGIDVEYVDQSIELVDVARNSFSTPDFALIMGETTPQDRLDAFYRAWTRREAIAKADGRGLTLSPEEFSVSQTGAAAGGTMMRLPQDGNESRAYFVRDLDAGLSHMAALASERSVGAVALLRLQASLLALAAA